MSSPVIFWKYLISPSWQSAMVCISGDDVKEKKPDPSIYLTAAKVIQTWALFCFIVYLLQKHISLVPLDMLTERNSFQFRN